MKNKLDKEECIAVAIAGNPNVGKSTVFNGLTGMKQHTGNWTGKTVTNARGYCSTCSHRYALVDIPGTYSLLARSAEEAAARNYICFGEPEAVIVVCDAVCLERNLNLALQIMEVRKNVILCVNLMDEAAKKQIHVNLEALSRELSVPVVGTTARKKRSLGKLLEALDTMAGRMEAEELTAADMEKETKEWLYLPYEEPIEKALNLVMPVAAAFLDGLPGKISSMNPRWLSLRLLEEDIGAWENAGEESWILKEIQDCCGQDIRGEEGVASAVREAQMWLEQDGITGDILSEKIVAALSKRAETAAAAAVTYEKEDYNERDRRMDRILTSRLTGYPVMLLLLMLIFWLTITGANYPSQLLSAAFSKGEKWLTGLFVYLGAPAWLHGAVVLGIYRVTAWVVSVMLPPMAIFFPLFTLLEDAGYLPRVAFNLDKPFKKCCACGKQALTMCMGFGCNAAGITGCRIIDSPRERMIAMLTNNFVPCNGRFPTLLSILTMFFIGSGAGIWGSIWSAAGLTGIIVLGVGMTFLVSWILSKTILKGLPSSFLLELPPYRRPQIGKVIVRSLFDRTLFVLGRAVLAAAPAGLVIWLMANITAGGASLLSYTAGFLDPFARLLGLDGVILIAFILGIPANEIVVPIMIMAYTAQGSLMEIGSLDSLHSLLTAHGWTWVTAVSAMLFSLMHWPCMTSLLTVKKESGSMKWTMLALLIPTAAGILVCFLFSNIAGLFLR